MKQIYFCELRAVLPLMVKSEEVTRKLCQTYFLTLLLPPCSLRCSVISSPGLKSELDFPLVLLLVRSFHGIG
jgi:hypothetical protein